MTAGSPGMFKMRKAYACEKTGGFMKYVKETQYCVRLNLDRPAQKKLCRFIEDRNRKEYPYLPDYLLAACEILEANRKNQAVNDNSEENT